MAGLLGAAAAALPAAGCGDSASVALPPTTPAATAPARAAGTGPAVPPGYAGLGAPTATFARGHPPTPRRAGPGVPLASGVRVDAAGRVTGWTVTFDARPPLTDYERIVDAAGVGDLPRDRITVASARHCLVFASPSLKRLIGASYASVTTLPGTRTAVVQSTAKPAC